MSEYTKREDALDKFKRMPPSPTKEFIIETLNAIPAADVEPVVHEYDNETEYIGRSALLYMVKAIQDETRTEREEYLLDRVVKAAEFLPKARVEPVVWGEWQKVYENTTFGAMYRCSICGETTFNVENYKYCPKCGAHMERSNSGD